MKTTKLFKAGCLLNFAFCILPNVIQAQNISFDTEDYKTLGVYDTWEESPFRTGKLQGHCLVADNFLNQVDERLGKAPNESKKILAVQRSRFGSNTFGARINLNETFELTTTKKYVHVMIHKPTSGRVMLVGLGKRADRLGQSTDVEQFWSLATNKVQADTWTDAVFAIKGNGGIDIYSLVVVPDCESPHNQKEDYICYIDEIVVNNSSEPRFRVVGDYDLSFDEDQTVKRTDRGLTGIGFSVASAMSQKLNDLNTNYIYNNKTSESFTAKAGETVTPTFTYKGSWMSGYVYVDWNNDGTFTYNVNSNGTPGDGSEIVSYSYYSANEGTGKNSKGQSVSNGNVLNPPTFAIPVGTPDGFYRMRYKVDWNCLDAAGNAVSGNLIADNGGGVVDVMLNVHGDYCSVNDANRNGEVLSASDGEKLVTYKAPFGKDFSIRMNPERGFTYAGIRLRHGYNLAGDSLIHNNPQYQDVIFDRKLFENNEFTIPGEYMDGDIEIEGLFVEEGTLSATVNVKSNITDKNDTFYDIAGHRLSSVPNKGVAIVNGKKKIY